MKNKNYLIFILTMYILGLSCSATKGIDQDNIVGKYIGSSSGLDSKTYNHYILELKKDNIFYFEQKIQEANPSCNGKWNLLNDTLLLKCSDIESLSTKLSNGYMNQRDYYLKVVGKNKIKFGDIFLKRSASN